MKTRILILAALAALVISCTGPSLEGRWQDATPTSGDEQMTIVYDFAADGTLTLQVDATESYETIGDFSISLVAPGSYTLENNTLTMTFDKDNAKCDVDFEPSSLLGLLGDMAIDGMKKEMGQNYAQNIGRTIVFTDLKIGKDKFTYSESGVPGSAFRITK